MNVDEFLVWATRHEGRYELEDGKVLAMSPERTSHLVSKGRVYRSLCDAVEQAGLPCVVLPDGASVRIDSGRLYEPDALVYCGPALPGDTIEIPEPLVVVEVLSPSTAYRDVGVKLAGYFSLRSVAHYLIVDPDRPMLVHHARGQGDLIETRILTTGILRLDPPGLSLKVSDLVGSEP